MLATLKAISQIFMAALNNSQADKVAKGSKPSTETDVSIPLIRACHQLNLEAFPGEDLRAIALKSF